MRMEPFLNKIERKTFLKAAEGKQLRYLHIYLPHDYNTTSDQPRHRGQQRTQPHLLLINDLGINHLGPASDSSKPSPRPPARARARQTKQMLLLADFQWEIGPEWIKYSLENIQKMEVTLQRFPFHCFSFNTQAWKVFA